MPRQQIKLSVDPDTYKSLKKEATKANLPISTFIRKTLQDVLLNEGLPVVEHVKVNEPAVNLMEQAIEEEVAEVADLTEKLFTVSDIVAAQQDSMKKEAAAVNLVPEISPVQVKDGSATIEAEDKEKGKTVKITINMW